MKAMICGLGNCGLRLIFVISFFAVLVPPGDPQRGLRAQEAGAGASAQPASKSLPQRHAMRFLTGKAFPPFNYFDEDNVLTGFNVDIARAICLEMRAACDVKARSWEKLIPALKAGKADAIIASQAISPALLRQVDFTDRYYRTPGRFVGLRRSPKLTVTPVGLEARTIAVVKGTTHEAYIRDFFRDSRVRVYPSDALARKALLDGKADLLFGDAISLMFWLSGTLSTACCEYRGGPFLEAKYFGDGIAIAVAKGNRELQAQINKALLGLRASGRYEELFLRYFPLKVY